MPYAIIALTSAACGGAIVAGSPFIALCSAGACAAALALALE